MRSKPLSSAEIAYSGYPLDESRSPNIGQSSRSVCDVEMSERVRYEGDKLVCPC